MAETLAQYRPLAFVEAPATIDGGDVLVLNDRIYVGQSARTNAAALDELRRLTHREVIAVDVHGALHLKSAVTRVGRNTLLVNRDWLDLTPFAGWNRIDVDPGEPFAANALLVDNVVIYPSAFPRTRAKLAGFDVRTVDADELAKAEGGVTCCAVLL